MRVSMFKVDWWLVFGLAGLINIIKDRVSNSEMGFQHYVADSYQTSSKLLSTLAAQIEARRIDSYGERDETVSDIDNWLMHGMEGCLRIAQSRIEEIEQPLDVERLKAVRNKLTELINES
jgi:hypothetical protein